MAWKSRIRNEDNQIRYGRNNEIEIEKKAEIEQTENSRSKRRVHVPVIVRTMARYSRMAARSGKVLEDIGEPILADGDDDGRGL